MVMISVRCLGVAIRATACACVITLVLAPAPRAGTFRLADSGVPDMVVHPTGYTGIGGPLIVTACVDPVSPNAAEMLTPLDNTVNTWNRRIAVTPNLFFGVANDIPPGSIDFESVLLHEMGHAIGLAHPNIADGRGLFGADLDYTNATQGGNLVFNINDGVDNVIGSSDDVRGDDVNIHWFRRLDDSPFTIEPTTIDRTTYSRNVADLPAGHLFPANADRLVGALLGFPDTEAALHQGTGVDEEQRALNHDDIATLRLGESGLDMLQGTADDYRLDLDFVGLSDTCNIVVSLEHDAEEHTSFVVTLSSGGTINATHARLVHSDIWFERTTVWYFNQISNDNCPSDPSKIDPGACGCGVGDTDSDGDGTEDCNDACPGDPGKTAPGICGCGRPETDSDGDGMPDCNDRCPNDPNKIVSGACGCGIADTDSDGDGTANCNDLCPSDPDKVAPGTCGCGIADTDSDGDGTANCNDPCRFDRDDDIDADGACADIDNCPFLFNPGQEDTDGDGPGDACDNCPMVFNAAQVDSDLDGIGDACDLQLCVDPPPEVSPATLRIRRLPGAISDVEISFLDAAIPTLAEHANVYRGTIAALWTRRIHDHARLAGACGLTVSPSVDPGAGTPGQTPDFYYLVAYACSGSPDFEGSYGTDSRGVQRPTGLPQCP